MNSRYLKRAFDSYFPVISASLARRMGRTRSNLLALLLFSYGAFCLPAHADYDIKYKAFSGDFNQDGNADLFLSRPSDVILVPLDDIPVPIVTKRADNLVLIRNGNGTFSIDATLSATEISALKTWPASAVQLAIRDVNVDGEMDLYIKNFDGDANFPDGIADQILFAPRNASSSHVRAVDANFRNFFNEVYGWTADHNYFENTAIANNWYHYEGEQQTGWWQVNYINAYYQYDDGQSYLDDADDPTNPNNPPAFCGNYPWLCGFDANLGYWLVYGTYLANIEVIFEYENFNQDALTYTQAVGNAFDDPNAMLQSSPVQAESIMESYLQTQVGETIAGVLRDPMPWPELPDFEPAPQPRKIPPGWPDVANDPEFSPSREWLWWVLRRAPIVICGLFTCSSDGESDDWIKWRDVGWEWALEDLASDSPDRSQQPKVVIGESDGAEPYTRIPLAAQHFGALFLKFREDLQLPVDKGRHAVDVAMWYVNEAWINSFIFRQALFYDIGRYEGRSQRGPFYPCERVTLGTYPGREQHAFGGTLDHNYDDCNLYR